MKKKPVKPRQKKLRFTATLWLPLAHHFVKRKVMAFSEKDAQEICASRFGTHVVLHKLMLE